MVLNAPNPAEKEFGELGSEEEVGEPVSEFLKVLVLRRAAWQESRRGVLVRQKLVTITPKFLETSQSQPCLYICSTQDFFQERL